MNRFFKFNDKRKGVGAIQTALQKLGLYKYAIDSHFGPRTLHAVKQFQLQSDLNADGVIGPVTWKALGLDPPTIPASISVPHGEEQLYSTFGNPLDEGYWREYSYFCETPKELDHCFTYEKKNGANGFYTNKLLIPVYTVVYLGIVKAGLAQELKTFDGCYNVRLIRGGEKLSTHSWGIAVDHNASENRLGAEPKIHGGIVTIFEAHGFIWGGRFGRKDGMHFQYVRGY